MARKSKSISTISQRIGEFKDKAIDTKDKAEMMAKRNPWQAMAVAAAVGAVIGLAAGIMLRRDSSPSIVKKLRDYLE